jgi:hypothetical protein
MGMSKSQIRTALQTIASGGIALDAATEYELEDLGLIVTDDGPYAKLTAAGRREIS